MMAQSPQEALTTGMQEVDAELQTVDKRIEGLKIQLDRAERYRTELNLTLGGYAIALDAVRRVGEGDV